MEISQNNLSSYRPIMVWLELVCNEYDVENKKITSIMRSREFCSNQCHQRFFYWNFSFVKQLTLVLKVLQILVLSKKQQIECASRKNSYLIFSMFICSFSFAWHAQKDLNSTNSERVKKRNSVFSETSIIIINTRIINYWSGLGMGAIPMIDSPCVLCSRERKKSIHACVVSWKIHSLCILSNISLLAHILSIFLADKITPGIDWFSYVFFLLFIFRRRSLVAALLQLEIASNLWFVDWTLFVRGAVINYNLYDSENRLQLCGKERKRTVSV